MSFILTSLFSLLFLFIERIMTAKDPFVQQRSTLADPMKINSLLNDQILACPQNLLPISHELLHGPESARFLVVNTSASPVQEGGKSTPNIKAEEPARAQLRCAKSSASFRGQGRCVASQDESAATAITDNEIPKARSKRMRGASEALEIERHLADIHPRWTYTEEEVHFIWYYRVVLSKEWEDIHKSFNHRFNPRKSPSCLQDKLSRLTRKGKFPARLKKEQKQTHEGEARQATSHVTIEDIVRRCASLRYPWMKEVSRTAGSQSEVHDHSR
jgi:hypothetical protein